MKCILYTRPDNGVSVFHPAPSYIAELVAGGMTEAEAIAAVRAKDVPPDAANVEVIESAVLPKDRTFRDAWEKSAPGTVAVNMPKARDVHMARIRQARDAELAASDGKMLRAQETGTPAEIAALKATRQALRDLPAVFDLSRATTPEDLASLWPAEISPKPKIIP